jgi:oligopeptide transport system substrate-binding protein
MNKHLMRLAAACCLLAGGGALAGETLHRVSDSEPDSLDPQKMTSGNAVAISTDLFVGLIALDAGNHPIPGAAESWDISPDGKQWTFHLRKGLKWSNGDPLTGADFVYSFRRLVDPATAAADPSDLKQLVNFEDIVSGKEKDVTKLGVDSPDPLTVRLHLIAPRLALKFLLTDPQEFPLHRATIEKWGKDWIQPEHIVSNGPFVMKSWTPQSAIVMVKNPNFYDAASVKLDEVDWLNAEDLDAALRRFRAGELDFVDVLRTNIAYVRANMADVLHAAPTNVIQFMPINMTKGPLSKDVRLRQALNMAVDRETYVEKINPLHGIPAYSLTPTIVSDYTPPVFPFKDLTMAERIEQAKALMQAAGYGPDNHLKLTVTYPTRESTKQVLLAVAKMWQAIWVDLTLENCEFQIFEHRLNERDYELGMMGGAVNYDDYEYGLDNYRSDAGQFNWNGYSNPKFDDLYRRGGTSIDPGERRKLMQEAEAVVLGDYAVIPFNFDMRNRVVNPKLRGLVDGVLIPQSRYLSFAE